jgi:hypothetical protein
VKERWQGRLKQWEPFLWLAGLALVVLTLQVYGSSWPWLGPIVIAGIALGIVAVLVVTYRQVNEEDRDIAPRWRLRQWIWALVMWFTMPLIFGVGLILVGALVIAVLKVIGVR